MRSARFHLTVGRFRGAPVRLHWSLLLGAALFGGPRWAPGAWLGFALLILAHELGHALLVARQRLTVLRIDLHGFGGECTYTGSVTPLGESAIAWGGVLAQLVTFFAVSTPATYGWWPRSWFARDLLSTFLWPNIGLIALNLLPVSPLDGSLAWSLFPRAWARLQQRRLVRARAKLRASQIEDELRRARRNLH